MKSAFKLFSFITLIACACKAIYTGNPIIDQKEDFIWTSTHDSKSYILSIDSSTDLSYSGRIIVDLKDTFYLKGGVKGNVYPTIVSQTSVVRGDMVELGFVFIVGVGLSVDTVYLKNTTDSIPQIPFELVLLKTRKFN